MQIRPGIPEGYDCNSPGHRASIPRTGLGALRGVDADVFAGEVKGTGAGCAAAVVCLSRLSDVCSTLHAPRSVLCVLVL